MNAQVDAADAHHHNDQPKQAAPHVAHHVVALVLPDHPDEQPVERHGDHRVPRGKAVAALHRQPVPVRPRPLHDELEHLVEHERAHHIGADAAPRRLARGKRGHHQRHHQDHGHGRKRGEALHDGGHHVRAQRDHKEPVRQRVQGHNLSLGHLFQQPNKDQRGQQHRDGSDVFACIRKDALGQAPSVPLGIASGHEAPRGKAQSLRPEPAWTCFRPQYARAGRP